MLTLVGVLAVHEIGTRADVLAVGALGDELEAELVAAGVDAVGAGVVGALNAALLGAGGLGGADGLVPLVAVVAVGAALNGVEPAPVGIDGDVGVDVGAGASSTASLPRHARVVLGGERACPLGSGRGHKACQDGELGVHGEEREEPRGPDKRRMRA